MNGERKRTDTPLRTVLSCAGLLVLVATCPAYAQEQSASWSLDLGVRHTDNVRRVDIDEESETVGIAGVAFAVQTDRRRLDASIGADLQYEEYFDDAFDSEVVGGIDGLVTMRFVPERFSWVVQDNFGQVAANRAAADTPANRQNINYFSTGPEFNFALGARTSLLLSGRWSDIYYEDSRQDGEMTGGSGALVRQVSNAVAVSLNGSTSQFEFDEPLLFTDYEIQRAFLRFDVTGSRTTLVVDAGAASIKRDGADSDDSVLARVQVTRQVGARSQVSLTAGTAPSNTSESFRMDQGIGGVGRAGTDSAVASADAFQSDYGYLSWTTTWERSAFDATFSARFEDHEVQSELDRDQYRLTALWSRELTQTLAMDLHGAYLDEEFVTTGFGFDQWSTGLGLRWSLARRFAIRVRLDHLVGSSDDGSRDYTENRAYIGFSYFDGTND